MLTLGPSFAPSSERSYIYVTRLWLLLSSVNYRKRDGAFLEPREGDTVEKLDDQSVAFGRERPVGVMCLPQL